MTVRRPAGPARRLPGRGAALAALGAALIGAAPGSAAAGGPELHATLTPAEIAVGQSATATGTLAEAGRPVAGATLAIQVDPYPYRGFATVGVTRTAADGSFAATLRPERNAHVRVVAEAPLTAVSRQIPVLVDPLVALHAHSLGPGRVRLSMRLGHAPDGDAAAGPAWWFAAVRGTRDFHLAAVGSTREISPGLTYASAIIDPPARRFVYRVCVNPPWEAAMGPASAHGPCPQHDFELAGHAR